MTASSSLAEADASAGTTWLGVAKEDGAGRFAHGEQEPHPHSLHGADRGRAGATGHGILVAGVQIIPQEGVQTCVPVLSRKLSILQERTVVRIADVSSASITGTNSGSREDHSTRSEFSLLVGQIVDCQHLVRVAVAQTGRPEACDADCGLLPQIMEEIMEVCSWHDVFNDFLEPSVTHSFFLCVIEGWGWRSRSESHSQATRHAGEFFAEKRGIFGLRPVGR